MQGSALAMQSMISQKVFLDLEDADVGALSAGSPSRRKPRVSHTDRSLARSLALSTRTRFSSESDVHSEVALGPVHH